MLKLYSGIKDRPSVIITSAYSVQAVYFLDTSMVRFLAEWMPGIPLKAAVSTIPGIIQPFNMYTNKSKKNLLILLFVCN